MSRLHTYYDNLKVPRTASPETIRAAYRQLSQKHHPDRNSGDPEAARIMVLINVAYGALSDSARRAQHDRWIAQQETVLEVPPAKPSKPREPELDPQRYTPKPRSKPRTRRKPDDVSNSFSDGLRQAIRGAFIYHALFLIVMPLLASLAMLWPATATSINTPIKPDVQQPAGTSAHSPDVVVTQVSMPDLTGTYRLIDSDLEHYGSPKPTISKGKLVIRKLREDAYIVLEAKTLRQSKTFGQGHVYHVQANPDQPGKVRIIRSTHDYATGDGIHLEKTKTGLNFWETTRWQRAPQGYSEKYLDRGIAEAERYYQVRVEHGLEE
ncbi:MAG: J domain-containing protein [Gammaproteobacteria bacterium]|nr:J domain-containing protein [Gammaproteobacteria bacterium]